MINKYIEPSLETKQKNRDEIPKGDLKFLLSFEDPPPEGEEAKDVFKTITLEEILNSNDDYCIVGQAGIGKSNMLLWIAITILTMKTPYLPLKIQIKDIKDINSKKSFFEFLEGYQNYDLKGYEFANTPILFLLDGLDQIDNYSNIRDRLKTKDIFGSNNRIILATRPIGFNWIKDLDYKYLRIMPFDDQRIKEYLEKYQDNEDLLRIIDKNKELLQIPILLRMVKFLLVKGILSRIHNRTQLYQGFIKYLYNYWENARSGNKYHDIDVAGIIDILQDISYLSIKEGHLGSFDIEFGHNHLGEKAKKLIEWNLTHNLIETGFKKRLTYTHQSYQEYFASIKLRQIIIIDSSINYDMLKIHLEYFNWDDVWRFLIGGLDNKEITEQIINEIGRHDIYLAAQCLIETNLKVKCENVKEKILFFIIDRNFIDNTEKDFLLKHLKFIFDSKAEIEKAEEFLIPLLQDQNSDVRQSTAEALGKIKSEKAVEFLIPLFKDFHDRWSAASALREIKSKKAVEFLIPFLEDQESYVRYLAADILGKIMPEKADEFLISLIKDIDIRWSAVSLEEITTPEKAGKLLTSLIEDRLIRQSTAEALGEIKSEKAEEFLIPLLQDQNSDVRRSTARVLGEMKSEKAVESLIPLLQDQNSDVRWSAARALGEIKSEKAVEFLIPLLQDQDLSVCRSAAEALGEIIAIINEDEQNHVINKLKFTNIHYKSFEIIKNKLGRRILNISI